MRIFVVAVGRQKRGAELELFTQYQQRVIAQGRSLGISDFILRELPESTAQTAALRKADEASRILLQIPDRAYVVTLDERGEALKSEALAAQFQGWLDGGITDIAFLIGGPDGHGQAVIDRGRLSLALGRMTWPHGLARVMLSEQIYRSVTILLNHPYHRA